jgi:hypothetical protein
MRAEKITWVEFTNMLQELQKNMIEENQLRVETSASIDDWDLIKSVKITPTDLTLETEYSTISWPESFNGPAKISKRRKK